jgi:glutathione peroxidase
MTSSNSCSSKSSVTPLNNSKIVWQIALKSKKTLTFVVCDIIVHDLKQIKMEFYNLSVNTPQGKVINMADFKGKTVLIVNTATKCGLAPQFDGLEKLHQQFKDSGLVVLGFPCNQFKDQEPETNASMEESCKINFGVTFQLTEKIDVNGEQTHPIFSYLKKELKGILGEKIRWNFTKFLITADGKPYKRYAPTTKPKKIEKDIKKLMQ